MSKSILRFAGLCLLVFSLSGCAVYVAGGEVSLRGRVGFSNLITLAPDPIIAQFQVERGPGSSYAVGETVPFRVRTLRDGFLSLTVINPDGTVDVIGRNIFVLANQTYLISGPNSRFVFTAAPPRGLHRVRMSFTPSMTSESVVYRGIRGEEVWTRSIITELSPYDAALRDVAETFFYIR